MESHVLLLIDDEETEQKSFSDTMTALNSERKGLERFSCEKAVTFAEGVEKIRTMNGRFDGIIVDIKLDKGRNGNDLATLIFGTYRVPVVIYTATKDISPEVKGKGIRCFVKGKDSQRDIVRYIEKLVSTGIYQVFSGDGIMDSLLSKIYWNNLYPNLDHWSEEQDKEKTKRKLVRYTISLLNESINASKDVSDPDEMYVSPQIGDDLFQNGSIFKTKDDKRCEIILTPPCDLVVRGPQAAGGTANSSEICVCLIENEDELVTESVIKNNPNSLKDAQSNKKECLHYLPKSVFFGGGFVNFRKVFTYSRTEFADSHTLEKPIKVASPFMKNILSRFAAYYSRQGQPDIEIP